MSPLKDSQHTFSVSSYSHSKQKELIIKVIKDPFELILKQGSKVKSDPTKRLPAHVFLQDVLTF